MINPNVQNYWYWSDRCTCNLCPCCGKPRQYQSYPYSYSYTSQGVGNLGQMQNQFEGDQAAYNSSEGYDPGFVG